MATDLQAVIFDLDGVITNTAEYHFLAWKKLANELRIPFSKECNEELKGISRMESLEKILACGGRKYDFSESEKMSLAAKKNEHYQRLIEEITPRDILPGIQAFISAIKRASLKLGVASASKNALTVLNALALQSEFDCIVDAKEIKNGKPHPEIFLEAAKLLNVDPAGCIGIEDSQAGIKAIKAAGMYAVAIGEKDVFGNADLVVTTTAELSFEYIKKCYDMKLQNSDK
ncbi:beta-phosphoglucomutase [Calidifontibacillus oryziterrae]|uniref:beta-phosphoglucomutase n=1 Tax=Calidifontibacillus oryziterrae TaxID=1191699 RepID=UPI00031144B6|nr:beta-phosphoglucomutase [Calidifontibacillus oryziterrae]